MTTEFRIGPVFLNINELDQFLTMLNPVRIFMIFLLSVPKSGPDQHFMVQGPTRISNFSTDRNPDHGLNHKMSDRKIGFLK